MLQSRILPKIVPLWSVQNANMDMCMTQKDVKHANAFQNLVQQYIVNNGVSLVMRQTKKDVKLVLVQAQIPHVQMGRSQ